MAKTNLVIVESPAKAKTIGKYLGPDYQVKASMGHIRDLPKSTLGVDVTTFEPEYQMTSDRCHRKLPSLHPLCRSGIPQKKKPPDSSTKSIPAGFAV